MLKVDLSLTTLLNECALDNRKKEKYVRDISHANGLLIHDVFRYRKFGYNFINQLTCTNTGKETIGFIRPSYRDFIEKLKLFLNLGDVYIKDEKDLTDKLNLRVVKLNSITTKKELKEEFPYIYKDLIEGRKFIEETEKNKGHDVDYEEKRHYYYGCGLKWSLKRFIVTQTELYRRFINRRDEYRKKTEETNYNSYLSKYFDTDKIALYTAYMYLEKYMNSTEEEKEECLEVIERYMKSKYDKTKIIKLEDEKVITFRDIVELYIKMKYSLKDTFNEDYNDVLRKLDEIDQKFNDSVVDWIIVPAGKDLTRVEKGHEVIIRQLKLTEAEKQELIEKGRRKKLFYESSNYIGKAVGILKYKGYIAYIYPNGEVILDTYFDETHPRTAVGDAIYCVKAKDFVSISKQDKTILRKNKNVRRIVHSKTWEERVKKIIDAQGTKEDQEHAKKLIKRIEKRNSN